VTEDDLQARGVARAFSAHFFLWIGNETVTLRLLACKLARCRTLMRLCAGVRAVDSGNDENTCLI